jgi:hypothetical protein
MGNVIDVSNVGQERTYKDATEVYDAGCGKHKDNVGDGPIEDRLPTVSMPKAPDPSPFSIGPLTTGQR